MHSRAHPYTQRTSADTQQPSTHLPGEERDWDRPALAPRRREDVALLLLGAIFATPAPGAPAAEGEGSRSLGASRVVVTLEGADGVLRETRGILVVVFGFKEDVGVLLEEGASTPLLHIVVFGVPI